MGLYTCFCLVIPVFACSKKKIWQKSPGVKEMWDLKAEAVNFHMWFPLVWLGNEVWWGKSHWALWIWDFPLFCESPLIHGHSLDTKKWKWKNMPNEIWIKIYIEILCSRFMADWYVAEHWHVLIESGIVVINLYTVVVSWILLLRLKRVRNKTSSIAVALINSGHAEQLRS